MNEELKKHALSSIKNFAIKILLHEKINFSDSHVHLFDPQSTNPREQRAVVTVQKPTPPRIQATTTTTAAENGFVGRQQQWFPRPGQASGNGGGSPTSSTLGLVPLADARGMLGTQTQV